MNIYIYIYIYLFIYIIIENWNIFKFFKSDDAFYYYWTLYPIQRLLYSTLFPVNFFLPFTIMSHLAFITSDIISRQRFFFDVFLFFDVLSHSAFITFVLMSFHYYLAIDFPPPPFNVFYYSTFIPSAFCPIRHLVSRRFLPSAFFTSTSCRWIHKIDWKWSHSTGKAQKMVHQLFTIFSTLP